MSDTLLSGSAPKSVWLANTVNGPVVKVVREDSPAAYFRVGGPGTWVPLTNRVGLFNFLWTHVLPSCVRLQGYTEGMLLSEVRPPIEAPQNVLMNGVVYKKSLTARVREFLRGIFRCTDEELDGIPAALLAKAISPYQVVANPGNPNEVFWSGTAWHTSTTGGIAGIREPLVLEGVTQAGCAVTEPELAVYMSEPGSVEWLALGGDQTERRWEEASALLLFLCKVYHGCANLTHWVYVPNPAAGPVTAVDIQMKIERAGKTEFDGTSTTGNLLRTVDSMLDRVHSTGPWLGGAVVFTGTDLVPDKSFGQKDGDVITVSSAALDLYFRVTAETVKYQPRADSGVRFDFAKA